MRSHWNYTYYKKVDYYCCDVGKCHFKHITKCQLVRHFRLRHKMSASESAEKAINKIMHLDNAKYVDPGDCLMSVQPISNEQQGRRDAAASTRSQQIDVLNISTPQQSISRDQEVFFDIYHGKCSVSIGDSLRWHPSSSHHKPYRAPHELDDYNIE